MKNTSNSAGVRTKDAPRLEVPSHRKSALVIKRSIDILGSVIFFVLFSWLFLFVWAAVLCTTGAPGIYKHVRIGKNGKEFNCLKFRSMIVDSERVLRDHLAHDHEARNEWENNFKLRNDPRITRFGKFIRKTSLDELPQFWNVLVGDMSLVGPRPVVRQELEEFYGLYAPLYASVRPGVTGPWQVGGRSDLSYAERVALDVGYVHNWSVIADLVLIGKTVKVCINPRGSY